MRRLLGILLILCMLVSANYTVFGASGYDASIATKYEILQKFNIVEEEAYGDYGTFRKISKNAFINYVCNLIGDYGFTESINEEAIQIAEQKGLIHPGQTDLTKPINLEEAVTILIRLFGYQTHAEVKGGFPHGYLSVGKQIGLTEGIESGGDLEKHQVILLLYNALNCPYAEILSYTETGVTYGGSADTTYLYEFRKIYRVDGVIESAGKQELRVDKAVEKNQVMINGYVYRTEEDISQYLGMKVEAYVHEETSGIDTLILVSPLNNKEITLRGQDIISVSDDYMQLTAYDQNDKDRRFSLSPIASVVYNGKPIANLTRDAFFPADGDIRLIENNGDTAYDVVLITTYQTMVIGSVSKTKETIANVYQFDTALKNLNLESTNQLEDDIKIIGADGELSVADLQPGDVLRVADANYGTGKVIRIYVSREQVTGTVSSVRSRDSVRYVTVDGVEYPLSVTYETALSKRDSKAIEVTSGGTYTFYLDNAGFIAYVKRVDSSIQYGVVMGVASDGLFETQYQIKLYTTDGQFVTYPFAKKIEFNGNKGMEISTVASQIKTAYVNNDAYAVAYKLNADGVVTYLDLPEDYTDGTSGLDGNFDSFNQKSGDNALYRTTDNSLKSEVYVENDASVIWIDGDVQEEESYTTAGSFIDYQYYTYTAYNLDEFGFSDFIVVTVTEKNRTASMSKAQLFLVKNVVTCLDENGDITGGITGPTGKFESVSYFCDLDILNSNDVKEGDAISVVVDANGKISHITNHHSVADGIVYEKPADTNANGAIVKGVVLKNDAAAGRIKIDCGADGYLSLRTTTSQRVFIYDTERGLVQNGTVEDIQAEDFIIAKLLGRMSSAYIVYR